MLNKNNIWSIFLQFNLFIIGVVTDNHEAMNFTSISAANNTFVVFDPNVSILDKHNRFRYTIADQIPLVGQAATKFSKLYVLLSEIDLKEGLQTSLSQSALAVAEYNKLTQSSGKKLEVWLAYSVLDPDHRYEDDFLYHKEPQQIIKILNSIAQQSNAIFNGTVTTILLPYKLVYNHKSKLVSSEDDNIGRQLSSVSQWGFLFETDVFFTYQYTEIQENVLKLGPKVIIICLMPFVEISQLEIDINYNVREITKVLDADNSKYFGFFISTADTDFTGKVNMSKLVSTWQLANNWSETTGHTVVLSKAFDTPYADTTERKTGGWWRLLENSDYKSSLDYKFEEKAFVARENDMKKQVSFRWLKENFAFSSDHVEVIFSMFDYTRAKNIQRFSIEEVDVLLKHLVTNFKKIWMVLHDDTGIGTRPFLYELECLDLIREQVEVGIVLFPNVNFKKIFKMNVSLEYVKTVAPHYFPILNSIKTYVGPRDDTITIPYFKNSYLMGMDTSAYTFGLLFNVIDCSGYLAAGREQDFVMIQHILKMDNATIIVFYFEEDEPTVKLGAARMFQQRVVTMEQCRKLVLKWELSPELKLKFMMLHYPTSTKFYTNRWEMTNFIEYWQKLGQWAKENNTSVIMSNIIDAHRYSPKLAARYQLREPYITELGWWRLRSGKEYAKENMWINKIDDALLQFPDEKVATSQAASLGTVQIILIVFSSLAVIVTAVAIAVCVVKKSQSQENLLTKNEMDEFYNGMHAAGLERAKVDSPYQLPYEKSRHEINGDAFTIDFESKIGSGEFGMVCVARIQMGDELVKVAVKTVNPFNINKSRLKGFLSEIKVLAYIGKHEHVTQMIGANTQNLKFGKVYIFLELCELGSLEKYLGKVKESLENKEENNVNTEATLWDDRTNKYLELVSMKKKSLDLSISQDLLRWSHEICKGMAYLASKHVVHADLATRNVLLSADKEAKICDFGLSRRMYNYTNYVKQQQEPLPWKWMAPESLKRSEFSEKSDVWAYGMTIWEIFSLGDQPYPGLTWNLKFASMLEDGLRMDEPKYDTANMYWIMRECWSKKPQTRPSFAELLTLFD